MKKGGRFPGPFFILRVVSLENEAHRQTDGAAALEQVRHAVAAGQRQLGLLHAGKSAGAVHASM